MECVMVKEEVKACGNTSTEEILRHAASYSSTKRPGVRKPPHKYTMNCERIVHL